MTQNISWHVTGTVPQALYSAFLNAAGRVLYDAILYPVRNGDGSEEASWLIEIDESSAQDLAKHLKRYRLRAKVQIRLAEKQEFQVKHAWRTGAIEEPIRGYRHGGGDIVSWFRDPRNNGMSGYGLQNSTVKDSIPRDILIDESVADHISTEEYHIHRYLNGVAEGPLEIIPSQANMDLLNGVDFRKGCYVGQELTIRTKHTGVVRKRILPVQLTSSTSGPQHTSQTSTEPDKPKYDPSLPNMASQIPHGADIKAEGNTKRSVGKWLSGIGNVGLALCRLEPMVMGEGASDRVFWVGEGDQRQRVKAFVPKWMDLANGKEDLARKL